MQAKLNHLSGVCVSLVQSVEEKYTIANGYEFDAEVVYGKSPLRPQALKKLFSNKTYIHIEECLIATLDV